MGSDSGSVGSRAGSGAATLFDALHERILIVNPSGKVVYVNAAARGDFDGSVSALLVHKDLRRVLDQAAVKRPAAPVRLTLKTPNGPDVNVSVVGAPNGTDLAVVIHEQAHETAAIDGRTVAEVMRQHLRDPLQTFLTSLKGGPLAAQGAVVLERLEKVMDLMAVFGGEALMGEERVLPKPLIEQACEASASDGARQRVNFLFQGFDVDLPPVYGAAKWLQRAVQEIIQNAAQASERTASAVTIEISAQQSGEFLSLRFMNRGVVHARPNGQGQYVPFSAARDSAPGNPQSAVRMGLPLAQRIVELHGGGLRVRSDEDEGSTEVLVQLPTGAPRLRASGLDVAQVQRYAQDLAQLMSERRRRKAQPQSQSESIPSTS